ncbi:transcriptional repressor LexA [Paratissierella segnis]|uniref:Repressor LexA n=1 Tax=Paratissierella segnis TaxID=2763679 RepID=A0A926EQU2_9FIRM|nr:transcriptional repressor LexA [Paratissierella segnis]MBC8588048.1 repressor LexA [Paratissierella segnis]
MGKNFFSSNLKYLRTQRGIEQLELAQLLGRKSASSISEWESGNYTPKVGVISDIARVFGVSLSELMNEDLTGIKVPIKPITNSNFIPLIGTIAAGLPILAEENIEDYFNLDSRIHADFALRIKGDSMIDAGIYQDDIVFIRKQDCLENGEIGAILIENEATLKKFYKDNGTVILQAENDNYKPMIFTNGNISILGKLVAVLNIRG